MPFSGSGHEITGSAHFTVGAPSWQAARLLMSGLETRIERLEAAARRRPRPGISAERRKTLTDRAVLHGDPDALQEISLYRPDKITASKEQRAAAVAAGLRADICPNGELLTLV
jgi:hypothetical protein